MATNQLLSVDIIAAEALIQLENNLVLANMVNRAPEADIKRQYNGNKTGGKVNIRRPVQYTVREGATAVPQNTEEGQVTLTVDRQRGVDMEFSSVDMTLTISQFSERYITPAMIQLANKIDADLHSLYKRVPNWVGTPGQLIDSFGDFQEGTIRLNEQAVPKDGRYSCLDPRNYAALANNFTTLHLDNLSTKTISRGRLPTVDGVAIDMGQNAQTHTVGAHGGTPLVDGASQDVDYNTVRNSTPFGQTLITDGWATSAGLKEGDVFTIDGVFAVNPVSKAKLDYLQPFVLTADVTTNANAANDTVLNISPAIIASGAQQTVNAAPANNAAINYMGTASTEYVQNLVLRKDAFSLAMVPMELPEGATYKARKSHRGISVRLISVYDGVNDTSLWRFDTLYGIECTDYRQAVRLSGSP